MIFAVGFYCARRRQRRKKDPLDQTRLNEGRKEEENQVFQKSELPAESARHEMDVNPPRRELEGYENETRELEAVGPLPEIQGNRMSSRELEATEVERR